MNLGDRIRKIRKEKKITLVELSQITGVAQASLSRIETGIMKGTVESHQKIAEALGLTLAELYADLDTKLDQIEHRKEMEIRQDAAVKPSNIRVEVLTSQLNLRKFAPTMVNLPPETTLEYEKLNRETDKFLMVLTGAIVVNLNGKNYELQMNDTLYFDASYPHSLKNISPGDARIFSITSPPNF